MFDVAPPGSPAAVRPESGGAATSGRARSWAPVARGQPLDEPVSIRDQMRRARELVCAPREEALEWQSGVNLPAGGIEDEPTNSGMVAGYAVAGEDEQTVLGEALKLHSGEPPAQPRKEPTGKFSASRQTGRLPVRATGRLKTIGDSPPDEATPIAGAAQQALSSTTGRFKAAGATASNGAAPLAAAALAENETVTPVEARSFRGPGFTGRRHARAAASAPAPVAAAAPAEDETVMLDETPSPRELAVTGGRRAFVASDAQEAVRPPGSDEPNRANLPGAYSRGSNGEAPRATTDGLPKVDPEQHRKLKIIGGAVAGFLGLLLIHEVAFSVEKPSTFELGVLYPYGSAGAIGRRGERAPGLARVEFEYQGRKPCSARPDADTCLIYEYSDGAGFRGSMLVRKAPSGAWERVSDEGMPFRPARN